MYDGSFSPLGWFPGSAFGDSLGSVPTGISGLDVSFKGILEYLFMHFFKKSLVERFFSKINELVGKTYLHVIKVLSKTHCWHFCLSPHEGCKT